MFDKVCERRKEETKTIQIQRLWWSLIDFVSNITPIFINLCTLGTYIYVSKKPLTAATAFTTLNLTQLIQQPATDFALNLQAFFDVNVSFGRLTRFLNMEEVTEHEIGTADPVTFPDAHYQRSADPNAIKSDRGPPLAVQITSGTFHWAPASLADEDNPLDKPKKRKSWCCRWRKNRGSRATVPAGSRDLKEKLLVSVVDDDRPGFFESMPELRNVDLQIPRGKLVFVIGRVGTGKSTLLSSMLNEVPVVSGTVQVAGSIAYCPQQPWIRCTSLRENILFGNPFDQARYDEACFAADLLSDFDLLPDGDLTEIGERGVNLSMGQKQRVALARAVYSSADVVLLDDVLSAVDVHVGERMMRRALVKAMSGKTRILVTHAVHMLKYADMVVVVDDGAIRACGTVEELEGQGLDLRSYAAADPDRRTASEAAAEETPKTQTKQAGSKVPKKLIETEDRRTGSVKLKVKKRHV